MKLAAKIFSLLFISLFVCIIAVDAQDDRAQAIIDKAIETHGGDRYDNLHVSFTFRKKDYSIKLDQGSYEYTRSFTDTNGDVHDILNNEGFTRTINGEAVTLSKKDLSKHKESLNSVCYFTLLPRGLNDPAVKKSMIGINKINGVKYHVVHISFNEEGGGVDFEDQFVYWINQETHTVDFLAYSYHVNGGGVRFREAIDATEIDGVRFQNYINYKHEDKTITPDSLPFYYVQGQLKKLSEIKNENVKVLNSGS